MTNCKKNCPKCGKEKVLSEFYKDQSNKNGLDYFCKECRKIIKKDYRKRNLSKIKENEKTHYSLHKNKINEKRKKYLKEYYQKNKLTKSEYSKKWREKNKEKLKEKSRVYRNENKNRISKNKNKYKKERRKNDNFFKFKDNLCCLIRSTYKSTKFIKTKKSEEILGCTIEEFKTYIESKFESWMNWGNHGKYSGEFNYGWDIDHIIPISSAKTESDVIKLNHYSNLQPLDSHINRNIKRNKILQ